MIISLMGFMGCGKSSVGRELSRLLCCPFMDLDDVIIEREGRSIPEIFATDGEAAFRRMELQALQSIIGQIMCNPCSGKDNVAVVALGGGTVMTEECAEMVHEKTLCIYLRTSIETLVSHLEGQSSGRPMLQTAPLGVISSEVEKSPLRLRIEELMSLRSATYEKTAHVIIDTDGKSIDSISQEIISRTE